ncbi:IS3 family transposase [Arthrobacter sp. PAMC25564]|uniref:IS3 family transposase n=1 Tax=Arthrobacter sp. PAMC25564 TaxID=2565366 RepID=UPI00197C25F0|nr:IS3 family transposase [Arthrobacter sp. PAMC25564]
MDKHRDEHGVEPICKALQIAPSTYYAHRSRPESARSIKDRELAEEIHDIHKRNYGVYGARKIHKELHRQKGGKCCVTKDSAGADASEDFLRGSMMRQLDL